MTEESARKLQLILSKRFGRELTKEELEQSYQALMGFAEALVDLDSPKASKPRITRRNIVTKKPGVARFKEVIIQYV